MTDLDETTTPHGATWPDVALAVVEFAREETWKFLAVLGAVGFVVWLLFPRVTRGLRDAYHLKRSERREARAHSRSRDGGRNDD